MGSFAASMPNLAPARDAGHIFAIRAAYMTGAYLTGFSPPDSDEKRAANAGFLPFLKP